MNRRLALALLSAWTLIASGVYYVITREYEVELKPAIEKIPELKALKEKVVQKRWRAWYLGTAVATVVVVGTNMVSWI